jgi:hypothetical protein
VDVWRRDDAKVAADAIALWTRLGALPPDLDPGVRAKELCAAAYRGRGVDRCLDDGSRHIASAQGPVRVLPHHPARLELLLGALAGISIRRAHHQAVQDRVVHRRFGATVELAFVWLLADTLNALMAILNLIALAMLSPVVFALSREFFKTRGQSENNPF